MPAFAMTEAMDHESQSVGARVIQTGDPEPAGRAGGGYTAHDFGAPRRYLDLLFGPEAARGLLARSAASIAYPANREMLPSMLFLNLCLEQMRRTGDEACGLGAAPVTLGAFGMHMAAAAQGDTFAEALHRFVAAAPMLRPDVSVRLNRSRRGLSLSFDYEGERNPRQDLMVEIFVIAAQCGFRWLTGRRLRPVQLRIGLASPPVGPSLLLPLIAKTAARKGQGVTLVYAPVDADAPLQLVKYQRWAVHELGEFVQMLEEAAQERLNPASAPAPDIVSQVRGVIGPGAWGEAAAARRLGMSTATLRRRMTEAAVTFRELSSGIRRREAANLLATDHPFDDIAVSLGFSDTRSLRRACKAWFGVAPAEYRRAAVLGGGDRNVLK